MKEPRHVPSGEPHPIDFDGDERRGLVATVERDGTSATISILDLDFTATGQPAARIVAAYRRWLTLAEGSVAARSRRLRARRRGPAQ
jgi:hypothetical protein